MPMEQETADEAEAKRRRRVARQGLIQRDYSSAGPSHKRTVQHALHSKKIDGADLVKKGTSAVASSRVLLSFPGCLNLPPGATIGRLEKLDSKLPECTLLLGDDGAKVHLRGVVIHPKNAIFPVRFANKRGMSAPVITCEDPVASVLLFTEWWIEGKEDPCSSGSSRPLWKPLLPEHGEREISSSPDFLPVATTEDDMLKSNKTESFPQKSLAELKETIVDVDSKRAKSEDPLSHRLGQQDRRARPAISSGIELSHDGSTRLGPPDNGLVIDLPSPPTAQPRRHRRNPGPVIDLESDCGTEAQKKLSECESEEHQARRSARKRKLVVCETQDSQGSDDAPSPINDKRELSDPSQESDGSDYNPE